MCAQGGHSTREGKRPKEESTPTGVEAGAKVGAEVEAGAKVGAEVEAGAEVGAEVEAGAEAGAE